MTNLVQCPQCERWLINEEVAFHKCRTKVEDIRYDWFVKTELDDYGEVIIVKGHDGVLYRITSFLPPKNQHPFKTPDDSTEPNIFL